MIDLTIFKGLLMFVLRRAVFDRVWKNDPTNIIFLTGHDRLCAGLSKRLQRLHHFRADRAHFSSFSISFRNSAARSNSRSFAARFISIFNSSIKSFF
jgi:hypothetical protein